MNYLELLKLASPEATMVLAALAVLALQALRPASRDDGALHWLAALGISIAGAATLMLPQSGTIGEGMLAVDPLSSLVKLACLALAFFTVLLSRGMIPGRNIGEYLTLVILATVGLMVMVASQQLLVIFVGLELVGLSLYVMVGFDRADPRAAEAALKYFLFGSVASAFTLFGLSLIYGMTGSTALPTISTALAGQSMTPLLAAGLVMTIVGLSFKVAAAPFHLWAPDAYQSGPVTTSAFIASASKVAAFFVFARVLLTGFGPAEGSAGFRAFAAGWAPALAILAAASVIVGNLTALAQKNLRRMLAYSAVAHAGYALLGILGGGTAGYSAVIFYSIAYAATTLGAFGIVALVRRSTGGDDIADFAGLSRRSPLLAGCLAIFLLSLAGLPPLAGFFGKFYLFAAALAAGRDLGLVWLVALALAGSLVSLYYYLGVLKAAFIDPPGDLGPVTAPARAHKHIIAILAAIVLGLGMFPGTLLEVITHAMRSMGL